MSEVHKCKINNNSISTVDKNEIVKLYDQGNSISEISDIKNYGYTVVRNILLNNNVKIRKHTVSKTIIMSNIKKRINLPYEELKYKYEQDKLSINDLSVIYSCSPSTIYKYMLLFKIKIRDANDKVRIDLINSKRLKKFTGKHFKKLLLSNDEIIDKYNKYSMSTRDIAKLCGCNKKLIVNILKENGCYIRNRNESNMTEYTKNKRSNSLKNRIISDKTKLNISLSQKGKLRLKLPLNNKEIVYRYVNMEMSPDEIALECNCSEVAILGRLKNEGIKLRGLKERFTNRALNRLSKNGKDRWNSLSSEDKHRLISNAMRGALVRPNKPETIIINILSELYPNEWKYSGDGSLIINSKIPDFCNINGQKKLIEMYGDYYHAGQNPQDRINLFKEFGYDTLIIWERELKNIDDVKNKIINFCNKDKCIEVT